MAKAEEGSVKHPVMRRFLKAGLIPVDGDDTKLNKLTDTASDVAAILKVAPFKTTFFSLTAFDPDAPEDDPAITEVVDALERRWATYTNTFATTPVTIVRAVLLEALVQGAGENDKVGVAFVAAARNVLPFVEAGHESKIWAAVIGDVEQRLDQRAEKEWAAPASIVVPPIDYETPEAIPVVQTKAVVNQATLTQQIAAAAGPINAQATNSNPYLPHNQPQAWAQEFSQRLAAVIASTWEAGRKAGFEPIDLSDPLHDLAGAVSDYVDGAMKAVSGATAGLQRRADLIWWKQSLFSPSARMSYRQLPVSCAAALMAFDLHRQVPTFSPASVTAFLNETVLALPTVNPEKSTSINALVAEACEAKALAPLRRAAAELVPTAAGRGPILGLLGQGLSGLNDEAFRKRIGVRADAPLTAPEWAMWLFRELQAARALKEIGGDA